MNDETKVYKQTLQHVIEQADIALKLQFTKDADRLRYLESECMRYQLVCMNALHMFAPHLAEPE